MDNLAGLTAFFRTADLGSFVAAGRVLGVSASAVGKSVTKLEQHLGVRLFQRSTRSIRLTEDGRLFHERVGRILEDIEDAQSALTHTLGVPRGRLRVSLPTIGYYLIMPMMTEFRELYPEIELDFDYNDHVVDLIDEGVDVAIRSGELPNSRLMSRMFIMFQMVLCASPIYLTKYGTPETPRDLDKHHGVRFQFPGSGKLQAWPMKKSAGDPDLKVRTVLACNNMEAIRWATLRDFGISCMPDFLVHDLLAKGELRTLLDDHMEGPRHFRLLWPSNRHLSPKVRVFVDFLSKRSLTSGISD